MAYAGEWECLRDALARVIGAAGLPEDEAKDDICRALADRAIEIRAKPQKHATNGYVAAKTMLSSSALQIPPALQSKGIDWERSCTKVPWLAQVGGFKRPCYWHLARIEVLKADVTKVLCGTKASGKAMGYACPDTTAAAAGRPVTHPTDVSLPASERPGPKSTPSRAGTDPSGPRRPRGRRPEKFEQTRDAMRNDLRQGLSPADLDEMLEKQLEAKYGVSRDVARRARDAVLSELAEGSNSRQIPTTDN